MDLKKELIGLRIFLANYHTEIEKTFGTNTVNAILFRMGQKPGEIIAEEILKKYDRNTGHPFENPSAAFSLFQNTITKLYDLDVISHEERDDRYIFELKNVCHFRNVIKSRSELEYGGSLCEFTNGYFESALKLMTGLTVEYKNDNTETTEDFCHITLTFFKNMEELKPISTQEENPSTNETENQQLVKNNSDTNSDGQNEGN